MLTLTVTHIYLHSYTYTHMCAFTLVHLLRCIYLGAHIWVYSLGSICFGAFTWWIYLAALTWMHPLGSIHLGPFAWVHSYGCIDLGILDDLQSCIGTTNIKILNIKNEKNKISKYLKNKISKYLKSKYQKIKFKKREIQKNKISN